VCVWGGGLLGGVGVESRVVSPSLSDSICPFQEFSYKPWPDFNKMNLHFSTVFDSTTTLAVLYNDVFTKATLLSVGECNHCPGNKIDIQ
jgi:hypothetical protein